MCLSGGVAHLCPGTGPWWEGRAGACPLHWGLKERWIMMNGEFLMATLLSSSSKYCSTISTLDYSKQWHNYVIFPGSLVLFLWGLKSVSPVEGLIRPPCSWIRAADLVFIAAVLEKLFGVLWLFSAFYRRVWCEKLSKRSVVCKSEVKAAAEMWTCSWLFGFLYTLILSLLSLYMFGEAPSMLIWVYSCAFWLCCCLLGPVPAHRTKGGISSWAFSSKTPNFIYVPLWKIMWNYLTVWVWSVCVP